MNDDWQLLNLGRDGNYEVSITALFLYRDCLTELLPGYCVVPTNNYARWQRAIKQQAVVLVIKPS